MVDKNEAIQAFGDEAVTKFVPPNFVPIKNRVSAPPTIGALTDEVRAQMQIIRDAMAKIDALLVKHDELASKSAAGMLDIAQMWGK